MSSLSVIQDGLEVRSTPVTHLCISASPPLCSMCRWRGTAPASGPPGNTRGCSSAPPGLHTHSGILTPVSRWHVLRAGLQCQGKWPLERNTLNIITLFSRGQTRPAFHGKGLLYETHRAVQKRYHHLLFAVFSTTHIATQKRPHMQNAFHSLMASALEILQWDYM